MIKPQHLNDICSKKVFVKIGVESQEEDTKALVLEHNNRDISIKDDKFKLHWLDLLLSEG